MNTNNPQTKDSYAIAIYKRPFQPTHIPGFNSQTEAEEHLSTLEKEPNTNYSIVYLREYLNRVADENGNFTRSSFAYIPELP